MTQNTTEPKKTFTLGRESLNPGRVIGREQILGKYWELANLAAAETKDNIGGQLKALDSLCEELGLKTPETGGQPERPVDVYRAEWLDQDFKTLS